MGDTGSFPWLPVVVVVVVLLLCIIAGMGIAAL